MDDLGTLVGHLTDFIIGNLFDDMGILDNPGIGGHDPVHIGVDFHFVRMDGHTEGGGRGIAAPAAQGGHVLVVRRHALESADHGDDPLFHQFQQVVRFHGADLGIAVFVIGDHAGLAPGEGFGLQASFLEGGGHYCGGDDFPTGHQQIQFVRSRVGVHAFQHIDHGIRGKRVSPAAHGGHHHNGCIALGNGFLDLAHHFFPGGRRSYGRSSEFLYNDFHFNLRLPSKSLGSCSYSQPFFTMVSAICRVFSAAPLRIWSPTHQKLKLLAADSSRLRRPTYTSFLPEVYRGMG